MSSLINYVTKESLDQMKADLNQLKTTGRAYIAKSIAEAREKGDLKENAEYDAAKEAQGLHEAKIAQLENTISNARILDASTLDLSKVSILTHVKILNVRINKEQVYQIVSEQEADLKANKISVTSPIGKSLLGKAVNEIAQVNVPNGTLELKVLEILFKQSKNKPSMYNIKVEFEQKNLPAVTLKNIPHNQSILEVVLDNKIDLHHNCGAVCACTTCHIYVSEGMEHLTEITDREEDYIDRTINPTLQSRLSCQAMLLKGDGDLTIKIPDQTQFLGE